MTVTKLLKKIRPWLFIGLIVFSSLSSLIFMACNDNLQGPLLAEEEENTNDDNSKGED